jgi:two-component system cell cycle sensor histidine kinase PleC
MPRNTIVKERLHAARDLSIVGMVFVVTLLVSVRFDFFEDIVAFDATRRDWHVDDVGIAAAGSFFVFGWYAWQRWRAARREADLLLMAKQEVEARNKIIEKTALDLMIAVNTAEAANQVKSAFLHNMSHELRTPLNAIIGFTDLIAEGVSQTGWLSSYMEYLTDVSDSGKHLLDLVNTMLDLAKIESGHLELNLMPVNLCELVEASITLVSGMAQAGGISISTEIPAECPDVRGDPLKLKQVLLNILSNAIKFTDSGGKIFVKVSFSGTSALIAVTDSGCGIGEEDMARVMQPFVQVDNSMFRKFGGTGLGLSIARELCVLHGGTLELTSMVGLGTTVVVSLPLVAETPKAKLAIAA